MKKNFVWLLALSILLSGCVSTSPMTGQKGTSSQGFIYPVTGNSFLNDAIARHKVDYQKDYIPLFTAPAPATIDACGLSPDFIREQFTGSEAEIKKEEKRMEKSTLRTAGIEVSVKISNDNQPFKFLSSTCPAPGIPGSVTVQHNTDIEQDFGGGKIIKSRALLVGTLSFDEKLQPTLITEAGKADTSVAPLVITYKIPGTKLLMVSFSKLGFMGDRVTLTETDNRELVTNTTWSDGKLNSISHTKKGVLHGEMIIFAQKFGTTDMPENRLCYKNGLEVKTTGACMVD